MAKILLVDPDSILRSTLRRILLRGRHEVLEAKDGVQAMAMSRPQPPDLVITGLIMPNQEGWDDLIELKSEYPQMPVIAMSGGGRLEAKDYLQWATRIGAVRTLAKPFGAMELLEVVEEVLMERALPAHRIIVERGSNLSRV